jgi:hypothetical protein
MQSDQKDVEWARQMNHDENGGKDQKDGRSTGSSSAQSLRIQIPCAARAGIEGRCAVLARRGTDREIGRS